MEKGFSIEPAKLNEVEMKESAALAEKYFDTKSDPEQAQITAENGEWIRKQIPLCLNKIKYNGKLIGTSLILPCTKKLMKQFITNKINEAELFDKIKESAANRKPEAIYLCSAFIKPEFRGKGIVLQSLITSIKRVANLTARPPLFYWAYSKEGNSLSMKVAKELNLPIYKKKII